MEKFVEVSVPIEFIERHVTHDGTLFRCRTCGQIRTGKLWYFALENLTVAGVVNEVLLERSLVFESVLVQAFIKDDVASCRAPLISILFGYKEL